MQISVIFCMRFQISEKMGKFAASIERSKAKSVSASGGLRPLIPRPEALPLDSAGGSAPDPRYRHSLCALAMSPLYQILNTPYGTKTTRTFACVMQQKSTCVTSKHFRICLRILVKTFKY